MLDEKHNEYHSMNHQLQCDMENAKPCDYKLIHQGKNFILSLFVIYANFYFILSLICAINYREKWMRCLIEVICSPNRFLCFCVDTGMRTP